MAQPLPPLAASVLVVDDEPDLRTLYELTLLREGYRIDTAADLQEARVLLKDKRFDVVITDMRLPDGLGITLLHSLKAQQRPERIIVMTAYGSAENAVEALKAGAFDYLTKPVDLKQFRSVVASAIQGTSQPSRPAMGNEKDLQRLSIGQRALQKLVGSSEAMQLVKQRIDKVARSMAPVLVRGESGTGKELVAQALHANSHRAAGPLVAVNCSAIPENLLEAEFFGAKKGSYTGAVQDRPGYFQAADYVRILEVPTVLDRSAGDVHAQGNRTGCPRRALACRINVDVSINNAGPVGRECAGDGLADAAGGSGDEGNLALEVYVHGGMTIRWFV